MAYIKSQLERQFPTSSEDSLFVYTTGSHPGYITYDGIDVNGKRISDEIREITASLNERGKVTKFSCVGYSLGGLMSRYAIGELYSSRYFGEIQPVNFITFCSPHVGVLLPEVNLSIKMFNRIVPYLLANTGKQLVLKDSINQGSQQVPLLVLMTDPRSYFYKALASFQYRSLYTNIINDKRTCFFTAGITNRDPFDSMHNELALAYHLAYVKGYAPVVIDYSKLIHYSKILVAEESETSSPPRFSNFVYRKLNWLKVLANIIVLTPLWAISLICRSLVERVRLSLRVRKFFKETSILHLYDIVDDEDLLVVPDNISTVGGSTAVSVHSGSLTLRDSTASAKRPISLSSSREDVSTSHENADTVYISNELNTQTDSLMESVFNALHKTESPYQYGFTSSSTMQLPLPSSLQLRDLPLTKYRNDSVHGDDDEFRLKLTLQQEFIIEQLNSLNWAKYPILIRGTKLTHAAAIVRSDDPQFLEGKLAVEHFVKSFNY